MEEGTQFVAWYAAIVATITALIRLWDFWKDRASLAVTFEPNRRVVNHPELSPERIYIIIGVTNGGRRPTTVSKIYLTTLDRKDTWVILGASRPLPRLLSEGEHLDGYTHQAGIGLDTIAHAVVEDALGRKYRYSVAPLYMRIWRRLRR